MFFLAFIFVFLGLTNAQDLWRRTGNNSLAPYFVTDQKQDLVPDSYIVRLAENYTLAKHFAHCGFDISKTSHGFEQIPSLRSYRARLDDFTVNKFVRTDPGVEYVEHDFYIRQPAFIPDSTGKDTSTHPNVSTPTHAKRWPAAEMSSADRTLYMITAGEKIGTTPFGNPIRTLKNPGLGVDAYVLDTGVRITHKVFGGRASNFRGMTTTPYCDRGDRSMSDHHGHGTSVASLLAGGRHGLSISFANIISVKVFCDVDATGFLVAQAIADIAQDHTRRSAAEQGEFKGSIINISFGIPFTGPSLGTAFDLAGKSGISVVKAAPNTPIPASADEICEHDATICVASCSQYYQWTPDNAYGPPIEIIAPGQDVAVADIADDGSVDFKSGNSMAAPIVGSVLSNFIGYEGLKNDAHTVRKRMIDNSLKDVITGMRRNTSGTSNRFINIPTNRRGPPLGLPYIGAPL